MRHILLMSLFLLCSLFLISFQVHAEDIDGDAAAGTYSGDLTLLYWSPDQYQENTGKSSSTAVVAFPDTVTLTFYKRGFTSETEFMLRAELNGEYYEDMDGLDIPTNIYSVVRWHSMTHQSYKVPERSEPSFNFMWTQRSINDGFVSIFSSTMFDETLNDFVVYFRAELFYENEEGRKEGVSAQEGFLRRTSGGEGVYYEGDGPYNADNPTDPNEEPNEEPEPTCNQLDTTNMLVMHAGVTYTRGDNRYVKNEDCSTGRIRKNQPFTTGDRLYTGSGENDFMEISLGTGTEFSQVGGEPLFRMARLSEFRVIPDERDARVRISKGKVMFRDMLSKVKELYSDDFIIETPSAVMGIRGTELYLDVSENGDTIIYLTHGQIDVTDNYGYTINLIAGQKVEVTMSGGMGFVDFITEDEYDSFEMFEVDEESNFIWGLILVFMIASPIVIVFLVLRAIKRKLFNKKEKLQNKS